MSNIGVFDVLGPIMIGPSSSHTAGAARLGKLAKIIVGNDIKKVEFMLHGSFSQTYKGHGTDRALVAGILGMEPDDARLRDSLDIAKDKHLEIIFTPADLGDCHPNTVQFLIEDVKGVKWEITGASIGGGSVKITNVNGTHVTISGDYPTIIVTNLDIPGTLSKFSGLLYEANINIAFMQLVRKQKGQGATMTFELDHEVPNEVIEQLKQIKGVTRIIYIAPR